MNKILIFGINGFTGKHFQNYIKNNNLINNYIFVGIDKFCDSILDIRYINLDVTNYNYLTELIINEKPDYIVNFAGIFNTDDFDFLLSINAGITQNIFEIILKNKLELKNILFVGSAAEYGEVLQLPLTEEVPTIPISYYGLSKVIQTQYCKFYYKNYKIKMNVARTFNIIGKGMSTSLSVASFVNQISKAQDGDVIFVGNLSSKRDYLDIEDVVDAYWKILLNGESGKIYNVCRGESFSIKEILNQLIKNSGKKLHVKVKSGLIKIADIDDIYGDNTQLKKDLGWNYKIDMDHSLKNLL